MIIGLVKHQVSLVSNLKVDTSISKAQGYVESVGINTAINEYQKLRQEYYESLATFKTFGTGWTNRVNSTTESALAMAE